MLNSQSTILSNVSALNLENDAKKNYKRLTVSPLVLLSIIVYDFFDFVPAICGDFFFALYKTCILK